MSTYTAKDPKNGLYFSGFSRIVIEEYSSNLSNSLFSIVGFTSDKS
jgi:hypothetical protein